MSQSAFPLPAARILLLIYLPILSPAQPTAEGPVRIQVHFHNYVSTPKWLLAGAADIARDVFRSANVEIAWVDCTNALLGKAAPAACRAAMSPTSLVVQLPTKRMVKGVPVRKQVFGYAVPAGDGEFARRASLFYDRIRSYCDAEGASPRALMGMALAHEIGHLLLERGSHSDRGLMRCPWSKADVVDAARGRLVFEPAQLARIQQQVLARAEAEQSTAAAAAD